MANSENSPQSRMDLSGWPTKEEAAEKIGVSTKTIEQMAATGEIQAGIGGSMPEERSDN